MTHLFSNYTTPTLGLGCWAIGGPFFTGGRAVGWGEVDDATSQRAIALAVERGIRLFDTAQAYGTGHSETVLGRVLKAHPEVAIATKVGHSINTTTKELTGAITDEAGLRASLDASRKRLQRDRIDLVLLHLNTLAVDDARPVFDTLTKLRDEGAVGAFGWSTDYPDSARAFADHPGFVAVEHAMNVFFRAEHMVPAVERAGLVGLIRSPLAMGILGGRYDATTQFAKDEVRGTDDGKKAYFADGKIAPGFLRQLDAVRDILTSDGRSLAQGAIGWLWARSDRALPIPGFRTPEQVADLCGALDHGPLSDAQMSEVEAILDRPDEGPPTAR
ncbi:MAG: aldo/keto reductase [Rhodobacteraceae bacterium]|nr:aldo/keto reductase [Paracoccaceae bacterium]